MIDIQHDSPVPIHEQITGQIRAHVATGALKAGARLAEYRACAQELLTNPQVVARAYGDLEWEGVLKKCPGGIMEVTTGGAAIARTKMQEAARKRLGQAVGQAAACGLGEAEILQLVQQALAAVKTTPLAADQLETAIKKPTHDITHRDSLGIQDLSGKKGPGSAKPDRPGGGDFRAAR